MPIGFVYIAINQYMPGLIKIGKTKDNNGTLDRIDDLYQTNVPVPFVCFYICKVNDYDAVEKELRKKFARYRVNPRREFFKINPEVVKEAMEKFAIKSNNIKPKLIDISKVVRLEQTKNNEESKLHAVISKSNFKKTGRIITKKAIIESKVLKKDLVERHWNTLHNYAKQLNSRHMLSACF